MLKSGSEFSEEVRDFEDAGKISPQHFDLVNLVSSEASSEPMCIESNQYTAFFKQEKGQIFKEVPLKNMKCSRAHVVQNSTGLVLSKCVTLPNNRVFLIGGSTTTDCQYTSNKCYELVED